MFIEALCIKEEEKGNNINFPMSCEIFWNINIMKHYIIMYYCEYYAYISYTYIYIYE